MNYYSETLNVECVASAAPIQFELADEIKNYFVPGKLYKAKKSLNYSSGFITSGGWYNTIAIMPPIATYVSYSTSSTVTLSQAAMYGTSTIVSGALLSSTQTSTLGGVGGISAAGHSTSGIGVGGGLTITGGTGGIYGGGSLTIGGASGGTTSGTGGAVTITGGYGYGGYLTPIGSIIMLLDIQQITEKRLQIKYLSKLKTYILDFWLDQSSLIDEYYAAESNIFESLERYE